MVHSEGKRLLRIRANLSSLILGQDESIYNQSAFESKQWVEKKREESILTEIRWCRCDDFCLSGKGVWMGFEVDV